jgi:hypothetical protein
VVKFLSGVDINGRVVTIMSAEGCTMPVPVSAEMAEHAVRSTPILRWSSARRTGRYFEWEFVIVHCSKWSARRDAVGPERSIPRVGRMSDPPPVASRKATAKISALGADPLRRVAESPLNITFTLTKHSEQSPQNY